MDHSNNETYGESEEFSYDNEEFNLTDTERQAGEALSVVHRNHLNTSDEESLSYDKEKEQEEYRDRYAAKAKDTDADSNSKHPSPVTAGMPSKVITTEGTKTAGPQIPTHPPRFRRKQKHQPQPEPAKEIDPKASIHVSRMNITDPVQAREIAEFVLGKLDIDVEFLEKYPPKAKRLYRESVSSISITSQDHDTTRLYANEPSTMNLYYEKGENELKLEPLVISADGGVDTENQVHLHRSRRWFGRQEPASILDREAQTREMTMVNAGEAEKVFRHMYPLNDDYVPPKTSSRQASLKLNVDAAEQAPKGAGQTKVGPKVKWSKKPRVLPPLPQDYHKVESFWTGSTYHGKYVSRQFEKGRFMYPLMSAYESEFQDGHIETKNHLGLVTYPRGDRFEGNWRRGRYLAGRIIFADGLEFSPHRWTYCTPTDRRFYIERDVGMKQAGRTLYSDYLSPPEIPPGCYDTGDRIFNPDTRTVTAFTGQILGIPDDLEVEWIMQNCRKSKLVQERYVPRFSPERLPCSYAHKNMCE